LPEILIAFIMDTIFGDPQHLPHPVRFIGKLISILESRLIVLKIKKLAGLFLVITVIVSTYLVTLSLCAINPVIDVFLMYTVLAAGSLSREGFKIYALLKENRIEEARTSLGFIVSRDTVGLPASDIVRGTVETISENIVDGIISPLFFLFLGGVPLAMAYKAASTMDSMIGYKTEKYIKFGWAAARLDDVLNFIPARITGFVLIPIASLLCGKRFLNSFKITVRDRKKHESPNSAHPEAAVAGALGLRLGGRNSYFGEFSDKPFIGDKLKEFEPHDIIDSIKILYVTTIVALSIGIIIRSLTDTNGVFF
jgi:adenosylcobinamide-phosphate synthase